MIEEEANICDAKNPEVWRGGSSSVQDHISEPFDGAVTGFCVILVLVVSLTLPITHH